MTPERWERLNDLYHVALSLEARERDAFLADACKDDPGLRSEVESLLRANEHAGSFLDSTAMELAAQGIADESFAGRTLGHYEVLTRVGEGGMGEVYLARDLRLGRKLALKILPALYMRDRERVLRFEHEARAASALNHPNILTIFEIDEVEGVRFMATEFVDGETLRQMIARGPLEMGKALDIALQATSALEAAHAAAIVHRDIKPENVMVRRDGYVKIVDFGLAKLVEPLSGGPPPPLASGSWRGAPPPRPVGSGLSPRVHTAPGNLVGSLGYVSPEQLSGLNIDGRADLFGLGVLLYEMVAGRAAFEGETPRDVIIAILHRDPPALADLGPEVPKGLDTIVKKAMEKERERRYQTAGDLFNDLRSLSKSLDLSGRRTVKSLTPREAPSVSLLEPLGGAVPLDSKFYVVRVADDELRAAIADRHASILIKGPRQVGKTSLLARGLRHARETRARVVLTDLQKLSAEQMASPDAFYRGLAYFLADPLDLETTPEMQWRTHRGPSINFEIYLRRQILSKITTRLVWALDEVDRLFTCPFGSEVFGLFRSWHNERSLDPEGPWQNLTLVMAHATEAHLFITDLNQSPFNVGTRIELEDFTLEQVSDLNARYGRPLRDAGEIERYVRLVGGHPYLVRRGFHEMVSLGLTLDAMESRSAHDQGPFGDHLRRLLLSLNQDPFLSDVVRRLSRGEQCADAESFYRLRSAGLLLGDTPQNAAPRNELYKVYFREHLR